MKVLQRRFYCTNVTGCRHARQDHVYTLVDYLESANCTGQDADGCGQPLVEGTSIDRRWFLRGAAVMVVFGAWVGHRLLFPTPLEGYAFETQGTRISTVDAPVRITVVRSGDLSSAAKLRVRVDEGGARAGLDYVAPVSEITLAAGERTATIPIKALAIPGPGREADRRLTLVLVNVSGMPAHEVTLGPVPPTQESLTQAQTLVRALSSLAVDVGVLYVKIGLAQAVISSDTATTDERRHYADRLKSLIANSEDARQRYVALSSDMCAIDPRSVAAAFAQWTERLAQNQVLQQRQATLTAQKIQARYCATRIVEIERWAQQLSQAVPRADGAPLRT